MINNTSYCPICNDRGFCYNPSWTKWFIENKTKKNNFDPLPSKRNDNFVLYCQKCNANGLKYYHYTTNTYVANIEKLAKIVKDWYRDIELNPNNKFNLIEIPKDIQRSNWIMLEPFNKKEVNNEYIQKNESSTFVGYGTYNYTSAISSTVHWIAGRSYRVEKDNKLYLLSDENGRILNVFDAPPTEEKIKEIHNFLIAYQARFTKEQKINTLQSIALSLEKTRPILRDALLELEYSGINDREIFLDVRSAIRSNKVAIFTIRKELKKITPTKEELSKLEKNKKDEISATGKKKKKLKTSNVEDSEITQPIENTIESNKDDLQPQNNVKINNEEFETSKDTVLIAVDNSDLDCNCLFLRKNIHTGEKFHTANYCKKLLNKNEKLSIN